MALPFRRSDGGDTKLKASRLGDFLDDAEDQPIPKQLSAAERRRSRLLEDPEAAMRIAPRKGWPQPFAGRVASIAKPEIFRADTERAFGLDPLIEGPLAVCGFGWRSAERNTAEFDPGGAVWAPEEGLERAPDGPAG